jgi:hypothetical protein
MLAALKIKISAKRLKIVQSVKIVFLPEYGIRFLPLAPKYLRHSISQNI